MDPEEAKRCFLKIRCKKCGTVHLVEFWKPWARSNWLVRSEWVEPPVWVNRPPPRKLRKNQNKKRR